MADKFSTGTLIASLDEIIKGKILKDRIKEYQSPSNRISTIWPVHKKLVLVGFTDGSISILRNDLQEVRRFTTQCGSITRFIRIFQQVYAFGELQIYSQFSSDFSQQTEALLPFTVSLIEYSTTSATVVYFISEPCKVLFKKMETNSNPFEHLEEILMEKKIKVFKLLGSYLFLATETSLEKWNLATKTREVFLQVNNITTLVCSTRSCFFISGTILSALNIDSQHIIHSESDLPAELISEVATDVHSIALAQKRFLYILSRNLSIYEVAAGHFSLICSLAFSCPESQITADSFYLYAYSATHIKRIQTQEDLQLEKLIETQTNIIDYEYTFDKSLFVCTSDNTIFKFEIEAEQLTYVEKKNIVYYEDTITCLSINPMKDELAVGSQETTIKIYSSELVLKRTLNFHKLPVVQVFYVQTDLVSIGNLNDEVEIFFEFNQRIDQFRISLKSNANKIFCTSNLSFVYILQGNSIIYYNSLGVKEEKMIPDITHAQYFKCDNKYMVLVDKLIEIREVETLEIICSVGYETLLAGENIQAVGISFSYLLISTSTTIFCLSIENKVFIGSISLNTRFSNISFSSDSIYFNADKSIQTCRNFLLDSSEKLIIGPNMPSLAFLCYLDLDFKKREVPEHLFSWTILPLCINIVHMLAYTSSKVLLKSSFKKQGNILKSANNISPLTIALQKGFKEASEYLVKKISRESRTRPYILSVIEQDLPRINCSNVMQTSSLYKEAMCRTEQAHLPTYIKPKSLESLTLSKGYLIDPSNFVDESVMDEAFVTFLNSNLRLHTAVGSKGSITFLSSLLSCKDSEVFSTRIIINYLNYKWTSASYYLWINLLTYTLFLFLLSVEQKIKSWTWKVIVVGLICLLNSLSLVFESMQLRFSYSLYLKSKTNWLDMLRIFMTYIYSAMVIFESDSVSNNKNQVDFSTVVLFLSYMRGMMHFKMFKETRYMIKMIDEIVKDSFFFALILIYAIAAFTTFYHFSRSGSSYVDSLSIVYLIMYGEFGFDKESYIEWLCFYFISIGLPLVMLNLLVTIMGGTYKRVYDEMTENDFKAMTQLILESEIVNSALSNKEDSLMYLHKCVVGGEEQVDSSNNLKSKIKNCIVGINKLRDTCANVNRSNLCESFRKYKNDKMERLEALKAHIERMKKDVVDKINA